MMLSQCLGNQTTYTISKRLEILGCKGAKSGTKPALANKYWQHIQDNVGDIWQSLDEIEQNYIAEYITNKQVDNFKFKHKYGRSLLSQVKAQYYYSDFGALSCLFFDGYFPEELQALFKPYIQKPRAYALEVTPQKDIPAEIHIKETAINAIKELQLVLKGLMQYKARVGDKTKLPTDATISKIEALFEAPEYYNGSRIQASVGSIKAFSWVLMLQVSRYLKKTGSSLDVTPKGIKSFKDKPQDVVQSIWNDWIYSKQFDEIKRITNLKGQGSKAAKNNFTDVSVRRQIIHQCLQSLPANEWISVESLFKHAVLNDYIFDVTKNHGTGLYYANPQSASIQDYRYTWAVLEEPYFLCVLFEYAATLGLIDVGYQSPRGVRTDKVSDWVDFDEGFVSRYDGLRYIRINALGAYVLGIDQAFNVSLPEGNIIINEQNRVSYSAGIIPVEIEETLNQFAENHSSDEWTLSEASIIDAIRAGAKFTDLKNLFKREKVTLPENTKNYCH
ncbi:hypothetical protein OAO18_06810 [Francisellaceae bacterium]|nr:hypothetical protein [Francisellaceae bacterium]